MILLVKRSGIVCNDNDLYALCYYFVNIYINFIRIAKVKG